jgi:hypothetical protein
MAVLNTGLAKTSAGGYTIDYSCRFDRASSDTLSRTPSAGSRTTWTLSVWAKRGNLDSSNGIMGAQNAGVSVMLRLMFDASGNLGMHSDTGATYNLVTTATYRDPSAWYHIVVAQDTTQSTASDRVKMYVNGTQITDFNTENYPPEDSSPAFNGAWAHYVGDGYPSGDEQFGGHLAEMHFIDGTALTPTSFGESGDYGEWKPKKVAGLTYGDEGFYLDFADAADLGDDESGEGNDFTENNIAAHDQMLDTPTNNFATLNPLDKPSHTSLTEGNLKVSNTTNGWESITSSISMNSGKWYIEIYLAATSTPLIGIVPSNWNADISDSRFWADSDGHGYYGSDGTLHNSGTGSSYGDSYTINDIIGIALDADSGTLTFYKNDVSQGEAASSLLGEYKVVMGINSTSEILIANFGQDSSFAGEETAQGNADGNGYGDFYYTPPSGYVALCTANLPEPAVTPSEHFNTVLYTGNNTADTAITGVGFQPDWTYIKSMSPAGSSNLYDAVRGVSAGGLTSNATAAEYYSSDQFTSFDSDGFTLPADTAGYSNYNTRTYVAWNWKANGSGSANTDGDMAETVTVSANTDAGFSIVTYTGDGSAGTVGHGLSKAPDMVIVKSRSAAGHWYVYHSGNTSAPETDRLLLSTVNITDDDAAYWNDTAPTSSVFTVGTNSDVNTDDNTYVAYCFHSVDGFSKFGSYTGNNDDDGTFVYTGFRPKLVILKTNVTGTDSWMMYDTEREPYNLADTALFADTSGAESTSAAKAIDILSNGFKMRGADGAVNDAHTYVYMAWAETPFKYSNAR